MMRCFRRLSGMVVTVCAVIPTALQAEEPRIAYWLHCSGCHLRDGSSAPPEIPTLIDEPGRIASLPGGREYLMRIPGVAQAGLDDGKLAEVLNFVLDEFSPSTTPDDFEPYSSEEVGRARQRVLIDPLHARMEIVGD